MRRLAMWGALIFGAAGATACQPTIGYTVTPVSREAVADKLDGHWFLRDIRDEKGLKYVELVYCPLQAGDTVPVCRTSVVWARGRSLLRADTQP